MESNTALRSVKDVIMMMFSIQLSLSLGDSTHLPFLHYFFEFFYAGQKQVFIIYCIFSNKKEQNEAFVYRAMPRFELSLFFHKYVLLNSLFFSRDFSIHLICSINKSHGSVIFTVFFVSYFVHENNEREFPSCWAIVQCCLYK